MPPRIKTGELPKPVIQKGKLGALPLNPLTASYLALGHLDLILGFRDTVETEAFKGMPSLQMAEGKKRETLSLEGRFFNGYSDALYRGCLPEVILAAPSVEKLPDFLKDFMEYLSKVLAMGFFFPKKQVVQVNPVNEFIPCTILSGNGLLFSRFVTGLMQELALLSHEHAVLDEAARMNILGRFVRGFPSHGESQEAEDATEVLTGRTVSLLPVATQIRVAGGNHQTQSIIQDVLNTHNIRTLIENQVRNPVERLEFENVLWRLSTCIFPALLGHKLLTTAEAKQLAPRIEQGILTIGRKRQAFKATEQAEMILGQSVLLKKRPKNRLDTRLRYEDVTILNDLGSYAASLELEDEKQLFETLASQVAHYCNQVE